MEFRDLHTQYDVLHKEIDQAIKCVLASGQFIGGDPVKTFEKELADYLGVKHCITCANGTDALKLALMAWGIGPGDAVLVPDFTFFSSGEVVSSVGAVPVFIDVLEDSFNLDPKKIESGVKAALQEGFKPRAVVAVDLFGRPADYSAIKQECKRLGLLLLEDGAQGFGGSIGEKKACSFGDISTTSFFPAKPLGCYGDGGAIFTDNEEWAKLIRSYAIHGKGSMKYDNIRIGMNSRLDTIQASILRVKFRAFRDFELQAVNERAEHYSELLCDTSLVLPKIPDGVISSWAQYTVIASNEEERNRLQHELKNVGVPTMVYYPKPMHEQKAFEDSSITLCDKSSTTSRLCRTVLSLPMGPYLKNDDIERIGKELMRLLHG